MTVQDIIQQAAREVGGFALTIYRDERGTLHAANAVNAIGTWAGALAQAQARALLLSGDLQNTESSFLEVKTEEGRRYFFGDAINACLLEGDAQRPSFWKMVAPVAQDPDIMEKIDVLEIARRSAKTVGTPDFGQVRTEARYKLTEQPIDALMRHAPVLVRRLAELEVPSTRVMTVLGSAAQSFAAFAAGEIKDVPVNVAMKRQDIVRLYMEAAVPTSKVDMKALGVI